MKPCVFSQKRFEADRVLEGCSYQIFGITTLLWCVRLILLSTHHVNDKEQHDVKERQLKHLLLLLQSKFI